MQVSTAADFTSALVTKTTTNRRYVPSVQLPATTLFWRVQAVNSDGTPSTWAQASFTRSMLAGPTAVTPDDGAVLHPPGDAPVLSWSPVRNAESYEVLVDNDPDFIGATGVTTATTSYIVGTPQPATTFWWKVRAIRGGGLSTEWSTPRSYSLDGLDEVVPDLPVEQTQVEDVVFDWPAVPGAKDYELRASTDSDFNTLVGGTPIVVKSTRYSPPTTYGNDQYWWQVRARDIAGNAVAWDSVPTRQFQRHWTGQPKLEYPAADARVGDPMFFQWSPVEHATRYELQMGTDPNFSPNTFESCITGATTMTPGVFGSLQSNANCTPQPGTVTYWRVRALDDPAQVNGVWSSLPVASFIYDPGLVTPVAPANGATVAVPALRWEATRDAERYHVEVTNNSGSIVAKTDTYALSWTPSSRLDPANSPYHWFVTSIDSNGDRGPSLMEADKWAFTLDESLAEHTGAAPLTPLSGNTTTARFPVLRWEPYPDATKYKVFVGPAGGTLTQVTDSHAYPVFTDISKTSLATRAYDWVVEAWAGATYLDRGTLGRFTITDLPPVTGQRLALTATSMATNFCSRRLTDAGVNYCDDLGQTPVLDWNPTPEAGHYLVYLYKDRELTNPVYPTPHYVATQNTLWTPSALLPDSQAGDAYFWYVRACKASNVCAPDPTQATHSFDKASVPIDLLSPGDGATIKDELTLTWQDNLANLQEPANAQSLQPGEATEATVEAKQYRVQISDDPTFTKVLRSELVDQTTYTPYSLTLPEGPLYWRVQPVDGSGNSLTWSATWSVDKRSDPVVPRTPGSPVPADPQDVTAPPVDTTPYFRWTPQTFAASYALEVYRNNDTALSSANRAINATTKNAAYSPSSPLPVSASRYLWRVRRLDADGRVGPWSKLWAFRVTAEPPTPLSPSPGAFVRGNDAYFSWEPVAGAATFRFERRAAGATSSSESVTTYAQSWAPTSTLSDGAWEWRVSSYDASRRLMASSPWQSFRVDSAVPTVTGRQPGNSPARSANWVVTFSEPVVGVNSTTMRLYRAGRADPVAAGIAAGNGGRTWTLDPSELMSSGVRYTLRLTAGITDRAGNNLFATSYARTVR